ncbi:hypothetical protein ACWV95_35735 [Streptomyces albus]
MRACAALGLLAAAALPGTDARFLPLLAVLVLLPPGATPARADRRLAVVLGLALGLPWLPLATAGLAVAAGYGMIGALAPTVVVLVIRSAAKDGGARHALAILLATAPWTLATPPLPSGRRSPSSRWSWRTASAPPCAPDAAASGPEPRTACSR